MEPLGCNELVELVTDCLEDAIDSGMLTRTLDHLQICRNCDAYLDEVLVTLKILSSVPAERLTADTEANLLSIYRAWSESSVVA
jgi:hypothetical protein